MDKDDVAYIMRAVEIAEVDTDQYGPGTYGCHEALHMANYFADSVFSELCEHPSVKINPEWNRIANDAADLLALLYRKIGEVHL